MRKKRSVTMYNLIFPVFLIFSPISMIMIPFMEKLWGFLWLLFMLGGNLLIDWLVTALALRWQKIPEVKKKSLAALLRVWLVGFAADFLSAMLLVGVMLFGNSGWLYENVHSLFYTSIYRSPYALAVTLAAICYGGLLIYCFNMNWALKPAELTEPQRKRTALALAVLTAPWLFLLPANLFYV